MVNGAGAAAMSCSKLYLSLGVKKENIVMLDSKGVLTNKRSKNGELNKYKDEFARDVKEGGIKDAMIDADIFLGLSKGGIVSKEMVTSMAARPLIFALANPDPEILPDDVYEVREDAIVATGRSDYPNQINNVLGFPYIFRGALDVRATEITENMKMAATKAIAALAKEPVPDYISAAYDGATMQYGPDYIIPKPFDRRVLIWEASAVAQAAVEEGVAKFTKEEFDIEIYREELEARLLTLLAV